MAIWRVNNATLLGGEVCAQWQPNHSYALGARCVCRSSYGTTSRRGYVYECTTAGTSHATTEPTWPTTGTIADGPDTLIWTTRIPNDGNWDNASCHLAYVTTYGPGIAAGDFVYVHESHAESVNLASTYVITGSSSRYSPIKIICVDKADDSLSEGAVVHNSNASGAMVLDLALYSYGITYKSSNDLTFQNGPAYIEGSGSTVLLWLVSSGSILKINATRVNPSTMTQIRKGNIRLDNANNYIQNWYNSYCEWFGGKLVAANGTTILFTGDGNQTPKLFHLRDIDLDEVGNGATATGLVNTNVSTSLRILFERCKLPSDSGFTITVGTWGTDGLVRLHHCSSADKYYDFHEESPYGSVQDETTIIRTLGASDGIRNHSVKMVSGSNAIDNLIPLTSIPITAWNSETSSKTFTIECLWDSATNIQDDEVWMELEYPADATSGLGALINDKCAILGTPADQSAGAGSGAWTTTGMSNPNSFKLAVTATPGKAAPITARVYLAKPSTTIYVDPKIAVA